MEECTFFEYEDVKVTNARFISGGQTFAMNNVTSVKPYEKKPSRTCGCRYRDKGKFHDRVVDCAARRLLPIPAENCLPRFTFHFRR
jgi:hypothetical protein